MNTLDKIITKIKGKLGFCQAKGCWRRDTYEINIKEINLKRHLCYKHTNELIKILGGKKVKIMNKNCKTCGWGRQIENVEKVMKCGSPLSGNFETDVLKNESCGSWKKASNEYLKAMGEIK